MSEHANHATGHGHATPAHSDAQPSPAAQAINVRLRPLPGLIFASRWLQLPLYLGLIVAQAVYVQHFLMELWHLVEAAFGNQHALQALVESIGYRSDKPVTSLDETVIMLVVLALIDVVMISNLLIMVIVGGFETFVSRMDLQGHPDQPEWLSEAGDVDHRHQLHPPAEDLHQRRQLHRPHADRADGHSPDLPAVGHGHCLYRQADVGRVQAGQALTGTAPDGAGPTARQVSHGLSGRLLSRAAGLRRRVAASPFPPCLLAFPGGLSLIAAYCGRLTGNALQTQPSCR